MRMNNEVISEILVSIEKIKYGEVIITIHNSKVVQIEKREKKRFDIRPTTKLEVDSIKNPSPTG